MVNLILMIKRILNLSEVRINYDYETNEVIIDTKKTKVMMNTITDNPVDWFLYNHGLINKPKRIIIYKVRL